MQKLEQTNFLNLFDAQVRDRYIHIATDLSSKNQMENPIGELVVRYTENDQPMYESDNPGEMYQHKGESFLGEIPFKDQKIISRTIYISNGFEGKEYRAGFLDGEIIVKRLMDDKTGKWPQKRNMRPYILLTPAKYHFTRRDQMIDQGFKPGETIWIPSGCELKVSGDRKKERIKQIIRGC